MVRIRFAGETAGDHLHVRVNDELVLDAGTCEKVSGPHGPELLIRPPESTLFHQLLEYLRAKPDPPRRLSGSIIGREGLAATAVVLRWGSYLAVLLDRDKPVWPEAHSASTSGFGDEEMARINIEAAAALADWIDLLRTNQRCYLQLVDRAVNYLPMPKKRPKLKVTEFGVLAEPAVAERMIQSADAERIARVRGNAQRHPTRVFANALVNTAWRNGPIEDIHAGSFRGYPLDQRRVTLAKEQELTAFANERLALGMAICLQFAMEQPRRSWADQVLPYGLAEMLLITPSRWTLTESSRDVRLPV